MSPPPPPFTAGSQSTAQKPQPRKRKSRCSYGCCSKIFLTMILAIALSIYLALPSLPPTPPGHIPVISPFEVDTINHFLTAAVSGTMPGNRKTELPLFPKEDMKYLSTSYAEWAPEPYNKQTSSEGLVSKLFNAPPLIRIMMAASGMNDVFRAARDSLSTEPNLEMMKKRIWHGMSPIPSARWSSMGLSKPENIEVALSQIQLVVGVFEYLHTPPIQGRLRDIYNNIWVELDYLQDVLDALELEKGRPKPVYNLPALWQEYIQSYLFENMAFQSRSFIFTNLLPLYNTAYIEFFNQTISISGDAEIFLTPKDQFYILNKILDLYIETEFHVVPRTVGFIYRHEPRNMTGLLSDGEKSWKRNNAIYEKIQKARRDDFQADYQEKIKEATEVRVKNDHSQPVISQKQESTQVIWDMLDRAKAHQAAQPQILSPSRVEEEDWVRDLKNVDKFGYVTYNVIYGKNDQEWKSFLDKLEEKLNSGWNGMVGVEDVRQKATLYWVDAEGAGIPEADFVAAKKHFQSMVASQSIPANLSTTTFLVVDFASFSSFVSTPDQDKDSNRGFLNVVSADFNPASNTIEGYTGTFKIVDQLVWTELYPLGEHLKCASLDAFWALAKKHPSELYVGPTTVIQRKEWEHLND